MSHEDGDRTGEERARPSTPLPTVALWRWRYEVVVTSGVTGGVTGLVQAVGLSRAVAVLATAGAAAASLPAARRVSVMAWWHVVTPHLFRRCCSDLGLRDSRGRLPAVVRTRSTRRGQQLTVRSSPAVTLRELRRERDELAVALWAHEVEVRRHRRLEHLVVVSVIRDDRPTPKGAEPASPPAPRLPFTDETRDGEGIERHVAHR
jgi:hypothetical protein